MSRISWKVPLSSSDRLCQNFLLLWLVCQHYAFQAKPLNDMVPSSQHHWSFHASLEWWPICHLSILHNFYLIILSFISCTMFLHLKLVLHSLLLAAPWKNPDQHQLEGTTWPLNFLANSMERLSVFGKTATFQEYYPVSLWSFHFVCNKLLQFMSGWFLDSDFILWGRMYSDL